MDIPQVLRDVAKQAHEGIEQVDQAGLPYWQHPWRVARLASLFPAFQLLAESQKQTVLSAAYLHDVLEDTPVTREQLSHAGARAQCRILVELLTKPEAQGANLEPYYSAIAEHPLARIIKCADIADNTNSHRMANLSPEVRERLTAKYEMAKKKLHVSDDEYAWFDDVVQLPVPREFDTL